MGFLTAFLQCGLECVLFHFQLIRHAQFSTNQPRNYCAERALDGDHLVRRGLWPAKFIDE